MAEVEVRIDALIPPEMADKAEGIGIKKANLDFWTMLTLGVLAGAFIAAGALFMTSVTTGSEALPFGLGKMVGGLAFCVGLILVVVAGAELFTGNNLIIMAWAAGKVTTGHLLRNWGIVYLGNFIGAVATAVIMFFTAQYMFSKGAVGLNALTIANTKTGYAFVQAFALGVMCNTLVCMAVWLTYSARTTTDKILAIIFPITAFVAAGFEHSVANMYFIPLGIFIKNFAPAAFWQTEAVVKAGKTAASFPNLTWPSFFINNLVPVTLGNIVGGACMVGLVYWFAYLRTRRSAPAPAATQTPGKLATSKK